LEGEIAYVQLNSFSNPKIDSMFIALLPELYKCKALVLDLRNNGGGSTHIGRAILEYLTDDTLLYGSRCFTRQHIALFKAYGALLKPADTIAGNQARGITKEQAVNYFNALNDRLYYPLDYSPDTSRLQAKRLIVPTVILTGHFTASAAEEFLIYADNQEHITLVGQSTFGSTGQPYEFDLPGGGKARICTKKNTYPDGRTYVGSGVRPDIEVESTVADIIGQKDPALDRAVNFLHKR
jgi:C-terminal processing protease CtpA/Prc